jgi:membrane protease YdiL (CAAX protease family)
MAYFKRSPAWSQILMFFGIAAGCFIILSLAGTFLVSKITGFSLMEMSDSNNWDYSDPRLLTFLRGMLIIQFFSLFIIPVFLFARLCDNEPSQFLGLRPAKSLYFLLGAIVLIIALPLVDWAGAINHKLIPETTAIGKWMKASEEAAAKQIEFMLKGNTIKDLFLNLLFVAVFAGIGEELFFRGVLQRLFIKLFKNAWVGIIVTAILFSAFHFQFYGFIPRLILGILLGLIYWYSGSLWPAIVAHFAYDAFAVIMIYFNPELAKQESVALNFGNQTAMAAISAALIVFIIIIMKRRSTTTYEAVYARDKVDDSNPFA